MSNITSKRHRPYYDYANDWLDYFSMQLHGMVRLGQDTEKCQKQLQKGLGPIMAKQMIVQVIFLRSCLRRKFLRRSCIAGNIEPIVSMPMTALLLLVCIKSARTSGNCGVSTFLFETPPARLD